LTVRRFDVEFKRWEDWLSGPLLSSRVLPHQGRDEVGE